MTIQTGLWQQQALDQLTVFFETNSAVQALILLGSSAHGEPDRWSDIDLVCVVTDGAFEQFYPSTEWTAPLGKILGMDQSRSAYSATTRICFTDLRRVDF